MTLVYLYGPNQDNQIFYNNLLQKIVKFGNDQIIMCIDWNFILNPDINSKNYRQYNNPNARRVVLQYMNEENLLDVWLIMNENVKKFTWRR